LSRPYFLNKNVSRSISSPADSIVTIGLVRNYRNVHPLLNFMKNRQDRTIISS